MELLVDIGNSRIKWSNRERLIKGDVSIADCSDLASVLEHQWRRIERPASIWVSSVAAEHRVTQLSNWAMEAWSLTPIIVKTRSEQLGVVNGYDDPSQLGVDRWMTLIGARDLINRTLIIVDCGTATTIDALDQSGQHMGGIILPGLGMMRDSLLDGTAISKSGRASKPGHFAKDTASGINSGRVLATTCLIERVARSLRDRVGGEIGCVLTGGSAEEIKDVLKLNFYHEPNLVLLGLAMVARASES